MLFGQGLHVLAGSSVSLANGRPTGKVLSTFWVESCGRATSSCAPDTDHVQRLAGTRVAGQKTSGQQLTCVACGFTDTWAPELDWNTLAVIHSESTNPHLSRRSADC